jgi:alkaline phosphatase D
MGRLKSAEQLKALKMTQPTRRDFITTTVTLAALGGASTLTACGGTNPAPAQFLYGVASGDPLADRVILWTHAKRPNQEKDVQLTWQIASDAAFTKVVSWGTTTATYAAGNTAKVDAAGLAPDNMYFFRFVDETGTSSAVGTTRTLPSASATSVKFAVFSCTLYSAGFFNVYDSAMNSGAQFAIHLGDYIYEYAAAENRPRRHTNAKLFNVSDYRIRYNQYRMDPLLQAAHARCPWFVTWDDHEVENNYAADISERKGMETPEFLIHRANAYQVYYEMMPLRRTSIPRGPDMLLYRKAKFGNLAELLVLDTRQYRSDQPNGDGLAPINDATLSPKQTMLGQTQREWLEQGLKASTGTWNVLAQQVMMGMVDRSMGPEQKYSMDQWPGYAGERMALAKFIQENRIRNTVVLTGDIHTNWVNDIRVDDRKPELPVVATEFVGTSITSGGNGVDKPKILDDLLRENPFVKFHNQQRGYVRCRVTPTQWTSDFMVVDQVAKEGGVVTKRASFVVDAGKPGARSV